MKITIPKGLPKIQWWLDHDVVPCYHGTFSHKYMSIQNQGLIPNPQTC